MIESTKDGGAAVIDISGSLSVSFATDGNFIKSYYPLDIKGAGKVTVTSAGNSIAALFNATSYSLTYEGGAICCDDANAILQVFICTDLGINRGSIDVASEYSSFVAESCTIKDSSVVVDKIQSRPQTETLYVTIEKSYVDLGAVITYGHL